MPKKSRRYALALLVLATPSWGYFLDKSRNFDVRLRTYSQLGIMATDAEKDQPTRYKFGDLAQHRNFYNPEFDARLTDYVSPLGRVPWLSALAPDDFKFRFAWWGFYDGLYDYLDPEWNDARKAYKARFSETDRLRESLVFADQNKNPRHVYASRNRINELYLDYSKGPVFVRVGRQAISWGEADTIALLDVSNPFDLTLGAPGFFQDVEEARIPLWTLRSTVKLVDNWGALSSVFADAYVVPGVIDTTVPIDPITAGPSPFVPDIPDPQNQIAAVGQNDTLHVIVASRQPRQTWGNTRWGARLEGVLWNDYTLQAWFFRTFNQNPVPLLHSPGSFDLNVQHRLGKTFIDDRGFAIPPDQCLDQTGAAAVGHTPAGRRCSAALPVLTTLERRLESVIGLSATWYNALLNGIVRTEMEYFLDELGFVPDKNLNPQVQVPSGLRKGTAAAHASTSIPKADFLRFVLGFDRFFFIRALNPSNSFTFSTSFNGFINLSEIDHGPDYRSYGQTKPGKLQTDLGVIPGSTICTPSALANPAFRKSTLANVCVTSPAKNFEDLYPFEGFLQTALITDYLHGRLEPRIIIITDVSGIFGFDPSVTYRLTDNFLLSASYLGIESTRRAFLGTFKGHDMFQLRVTFQLN